MSDAKTKLTLWVSEDVVAFGKRWSRGHNSSISELFTKFLQSLKEREQTSESVTPLVGELTGVLKKTKTDRKQYRKHLEKKYL